MKLFKITLDYAGYDTFDSAVVAAETISQITDMLENGNSILDEETHSYEIAKRFREEQKLWRKGNQSYNIEEIGTTQKYKEPTIICSSFNAG